jgi:hypothetical protein
VRIFVTNCDRCFNISSCLVAKVIINFACERVFEANGGHLWANCQHRDLALDLHEQILRVGGGRFPPTLSHPQRIDRIGVSLEIAAVVPVELSIEIDVEDDSTASTV